jgi:hypothetical protein
VAKLSNLGDEALQSIEPCVGFHQILSLAGNTGTKAQEETASADETPLSSSEIPAVRFEEEPSVAGVWIRHAQNDDGVFLTDSGGEAERGLANDLTIAALWDDPLSGSLAIIPP